VGGSYRGLGSGPGGSVKLTGGLPPVGPPLPASPGGAEAGDDQVRVLECRLLGREVAAGAD
jgi:hypothetical protein